jgi:hypothetical protein
MKIVVNHCYGGFGVNPDYNVLLKHYENEQELRTNPILIDLIESGIYVDSRYAKLAVVEIPDNATDWDIWEYDGMETVICVVDEKLRYL